MSCPGVFIGMAGQDTAFGVDGHDWDDSQQQVSEEQWKRMTYPAGRIMHLLPRRLVTGRRGMQLCKCTRWVSMIRCSHCPGVFSQAG